MKNFTRPLGSIVLLAMLLINSFSYAGSTSAKEKASKDVSNSCPTITVTLSATNLTCHGSNNGTASIASVTGGVAPYTYSWNTGATTSTLSNLAVGSYTVTAKDANGCTGSKSISISQPGVLSVTINHNNVSCNGNNNGNATATVGGGTSPYVYAWSNGLTVSATPANLSPGTYTILVTDANSCQTTGSVTVTQPTALSLSTSSTNVNCNGNGTATVVASGGNGSYTYKWNNNATTATITGLAAGTYSVIVKDANLCVATATGVVVSNPGPLSASATHTNVTCSALGTATVTASGSTSPYTYLWSNGATTSSVSGLVAGTYSVTVYDVYNCSTSVTGITITQPSAVTANGSTTNVSCFGGSNGTASVTAGGGTSPYTYSWNTGATTSSISSLSAGTYSVTVTDHNGCTGTATGLVVSQPASALSSSGSKTNVSCNGGNNGTASVTASGGTSGYTYLWSNGATTSSISGLTSGIYTVTVTDAHGCTTTSSDTVTQPATGVSASASTTANATCTGCTNGSVSVSASGGTSPYTYLWSNGATTSNVSGLGAGTYSVTVTDHNGCTATSSTTVTQPSNPLTASITSETDASCNGGNNGTATVTASGGTPGYTYSWSDGETTSSVSDLTAGGYTVTVTDAASNQTTATVTIGQPSAVTASGSTTAASCNGGNGTASVTVGGGTAGYTYLWSNSATTSSISAVAGIYSVTVTDAHGCTATATGLSVTQPSAVTATISSSTEPLCNGQSNGTATVTAGGGTPGYTYLWSDGETTSSVSDLAANTYSVTVTDANGCSANTSVTINQPAVLTLTTTAQTNVSCYGGSNGSATVNAAGGTSHIRVSYTYSWSPTGNTNNSVTGLSAGTYTVTVTDKNGCTAIDIVTITQPAQLTATITSESDVTCNGNSNGAATVTAGGGTPGYTYSWSNGETTSSVSDLAAGTYTVTVNDANHCGPVTATVTVNQPTAVTANITSETDVTCNGNGNGMATVTAGGGNGTYTYSWSDGETTSSVSDLEAGTYTVTVYDGIGCGPATATVTVNQPAVLVANGSTGNVTCNGGSNGTASVTATGGTAGYSYSWSNGQTTSSISGLTVGTYSVLVTDAKGCTATATGLVVSQPNALSASITSSSNASCYACSDGSVTITASNGTPPYAYLWSDGETTSSVNDLGVGFYSCTITDACTSVVDTITIGSNSLPLAISDTMTNVSCNGGSNGSITFTPSGGTPPYDIWYYNYQTSTWTELGTTTIVTGLPAGQYTGYVSDSSGDEAFAGTITITQPNPIVAYGTETDASCYGNSDGSVSVSPVGGTAPYNYSWNGGATTTSASQSGLAAGTYSLVITDGNSCTFDTTFNVGQPALLTLTTSSVTSVSCYGSCNGSATVTASGGTGHYYVGYTYNWEPTGGTGATATGLCAGTYTVTVTDLHNCTAIDTLTIGQPAQLIAAITSETDVTCNGGSNGASTVTANGGTPAYTYTWSDGETTSAVSDLAAGTYTVFVNDANGCGPDTATVTVNQPNALSASVSGSNASCPSCSDGSATVTASNGTPPYSYTWSDGETTSSVNDLSPGFYSVTVTDACTSVTDTITIGSNGTGVFTLNYTTSTNNCYSGGSITLTESNGVGPYYFEYYSSNVGYWQYAPGGYYTNSTSVTITGLSTGYYEGYIYDNSTGQSLYTANFYFNDNAPAAPGMCYVTVDTAKEHNVVYWANNGNDNVLSTINIYREAVSGYVQVGSISPTATSFTDTTSHSDVESNYYYVTGTDSCGVTSSQSNINQTVLLQANIGVGGVVNLSWNAAGVTSSVDYYVIMRDTGTGFHNYDSVPFNIYAYTDLKPTNGPLQYMVNTVWSPLSCASINTSRSNKKVINVTGINELSNPLSSITVYPNPVKDQVTISIPTPTEGVISMTDVLGQQVYSTKLENNETTKQIDMTNLSQGVYMIKITSGDKQIVKRIVKL